MLLHSALKKPSEQFWHKIILLVPLILTYLLSGPQVIRKEIQQQKCKDLETPPEGPNTAFIERLRPLSRPKLLWKLFQTFREDWVQYSRFSDYLKAARKPMSDVWGSRSPAKGPERSQQEGWFFAGNREATNAEFGDSWSLPPVFRLVLLGSCFNVVPCCLPWTFKSQKSIVWGLQFSVDPRS